ncbi:MAG: GNAT family N-acetyltransferase [Promethearchaeota archaeon]|nr:MAG: GNAT family N-acetyltransferase [Candidatus Lokiarchaeota archaeon]
MLVIIQATTKELIEQARELFIEYSNYLGIDLSFQNFKEELKNFPGNYIPPEGCILLAYFNEKLTGCVAVRKYEDDICEMKRLYVRPQYRRKNIGRNLSNTIIEKAKKMGYKSIRLDTLPFMKEAIMLYCNLGFEEIAPYRYNPFKDAKFFELKL